MGGITDDNEVDNNRVNGPISQVLGRFFQSITGKKIIDNTVITGDPEVEEWEEEEEAITSDQESDSFNNKTDTTGSILGAECADNFPWWFIVVFQVVLGLATIIVLKLFNRVRKFWFVPLIFGIIFQIAHSILGCACTRNYWCPKYIFINLALTIITLSICYHLYHYKKTDTSRD